MGANILVNRIADLPLPGVFDHSRQAAATATTLDTTQQEILSFANAIAVGFQLLTQAGPLCDEPVMGVAFELLGVTIEPSAPVPDSSFGGIVIAAAKEAFRQVGERGDEGMACCVELWAKERTSSVPCWQQGRHTHYKKKDFVSLSLSRSHLHRLPTSSPLFPLPLFLSLHCKLMSLFVYPPLLTTS